MRPGRQGSGVVNHIPVHVVALILLFTKQDALQFWYRDGTVVDEERKVNDEQQYEQANQPVGVINAEITNQFLVIRIRQKIRVVVLKFKGESIVF